MDRVVRAHTPLGEEQLLFRAMHGTEGLSLLYEFEVDLLGRDPAIDLQSVLGKPLTLEILTAGESPRYLDGQVVRFSMRGREGGTERYTVYRATVRPWLWYLTRASDCRIFQNKSVVEIIEEVLGSYGFPFEKKLCASYRPWEYCAQYNESDFDFVSRLMALEGIYYYFTHEKGRHTLVLADDASAHEPMPGYASIDHFAADRPVTEDMEVIDDWQVTEEVRPGGYVVDDFNFTTPRGDLSATRSQPRSHDHDGYDMYEWLGDYADAGQAEHYARVRLEETQSLASRSTGHATVRGMAPGFTFSLCNAPRGDDNREYLIVSVTYALREGGYASDDAASGSSLGFGFIVQPVDLPFRAPRQAPQPLMSGPQTATVVGPEGEEIWTDEYGRVKVQFHWDRYGERNENSSRFVRVSHIWAGERFGGVFTPRIGQEVVVDFIGGRPDRPVIVGRVYNADQMPPFALPGEATKSGVVTRSSKGGSAANANAFVFEDAMGAEQILVHAERNLDVEVEADETHTTGATRTTLIKGHESATYESGEERHITGGAVETIDDGEERTVTGGATERVTGGEKRTIKGGADETITGGERRVVNGGITERVNGCVMLTVNGTVLRIVSGTDIRITGGGRIEIVNAVDAKVVLGPELTVITGPKVVYAPTIVNDSTHYTINTTNYILNAEVIVYNIPKETTNSEDHDHWKWTNYHAMGGRIVNFAQAYDLYVGKVQVSGAFVSFNGIFVNLSKFNSIQHRFRREFQIIDIKHLRSNIRTKGLKATWAAFYLKSN